MFSLSYVCSEKTHLALIKLIILKKRKREKKGKKL
jgi:hypothetical protein